MPHKKIKLNEKKIIDKFFRFSKSSKNYVLRTKEMERDLLINILNTTQLKYNHSVQFAEKNCKRDGCYAIIGISHNSVFKLISGRRYENKFVLFNEEEVDQIQKDYYKFYTFLKKSDLIIPESLGTFTIELNLKNQRRFLFLEQQEKFI